jgi:hypothetical protein
LMHPSRTLWSLPNCSGSKGSPINFAMYENIVRKIWKIT